MNVLLVITDGRADYLQRTWASAQDMLCFPEPPTVVLVDDSATPAHTKMAAELTEAKYVWAHPQKQGGAAAIRTAWKHISDLADVDYIFHLEDDWTFPLPLDVQDMIDKLNLSYRMANMVVRRQPVGVEGPNGYVDRSYRQCAGHLEHTNGFWLNPCVYPRHIINHEWPENGHEHHFTASLLAEGHTFGVYGDRDDPPRCTHIGDYRSVGAMW